MKVFAKFDEIPSMILEVIKETKRYGHTFGRTVVRSVGQRENSIIIIIIIIIITLFQEDNIFGRVASLTYGPQLTNVGHDIIKMNRHACTIIYSMYRVNALRTPSRLRAGYPTLLQWRGRYDFSRLKTSRVLPYTSVLVIECFLTRSMLFLKCIYTHYIQSFFFTCTISETLFKLITHCFCCLLRCVEFSRSLTMSMH